MRHVPADKYNVAWFKLAEFVARGEKERAFGLYRLLIHSFDDYAFGCQLAGDLLLSFNDPEAIVKYREAAALYKKAGKYTEAAAVHEHLVSLASSVTENLKALIELYIVLRSAKQHFETYVRLVHRLLEEARYQELADLLSGLHKEKAEHNFQDYAALQKELVFVGAFYTVDPVTRSLFLTPVRELFVHDEQGLNQFCEKLRALNPEWHQAFVALL